MRGTHADENGVGRSRVELAALAGMIGLALLLTVESSAGPVVLTPVLRYQPPARFQPPTAVNAPGIAFSVRPTVEGLEDAFSSVGYDLDAIREGTQAVPRLDIASLPRDLPEITDVAQRKTVFLKVALPLVLEANRHIAGQRKRLELIAEKLAAEETLPTELQAWLSEIAARYRVPPDRMDILLRRVDTVPPSLALAQAAAESGWGTSRFALDGNAIFGQWTFGDGRGLVPLERPEGHTYKIRTFDRLIDSFQAYLLNLNTHRAYRDFRVMREEMRQAGETLDGYRLTETLGSYSELGEDYVGLLQTIIRVNRLMPLDHARLGTTEIALLNGA